MTLIDDLRTITPTYGHVTSRDSVDIFEHEDSASVTKVTWTDSDFSSIDPTLAKDATSFFSRCAAPEIFRKDCDGIITFEHDGRKYMFLTELKSQFSTQVLVKAKSQIVASFIKTNMFLHLLSSYRMEDYTVKGFIVGHPPKSDFLTSLHKMSSLPKDDEHRVEYDLARRMFIRNPAHRLTLRASNFHCLHGLPLGDRGVFPEIDLYFIEVPYGRNSVSLDVRNFI